MANTGQKGYKVLEQIYSDDASLTGQIMPNIKQISPQAIIDGSVNSITFNTATNVTPSGGINGNVWYNLPADKLYKKIAGTWTLLTDRVTNDYYVDYVEDLEACPL